MRYSFSHTLKPWCKAVTALLILQVASSSSLIYASDDKTKPTKPVNIACTELAGLGLKSIAEPEFFKLFGKSEIITQTEDLQARLGHDILPKVQIRQLLRDAATLLEYRKKIKDVESQKKIDEFVYMCYSIVIAHNQKYIHKQTHTLNIPGMRRYEFLQELGHKLFKALPKYNGSTEPTTYIRKIVKNHAVDLLRKSVSDRKANLEILESQFEPTATEEGFELKDLKPVVPISQLRKVDKSAPKPNIHSHTADKLKSFIESLTNITDRQKEDYFLYRGLSDNTPPGRDRARVLSKKLGIKEASVASMVRDIEKKIHTAMKSQGLTMEDFLP